MWTMNLRAYSPTVARLLVDAPLNELGAGTPVLSRRAALAELSPASIVAPHDLADRDLAAACCAALWLRFDFLHESHHISQSLDTPEGSLWHAIMHRREPDFANAKYWFRRAGVQAVFPRLHDAARQQVADATRLRSAEGRPDPAVAFLTREATWDALKFVDLCEQALDNSPPLHNLCKKIQLAEWELLFDDCFRRAVAD